MDERVLLCSWQVYPGLMLTSGSIHWLLHMLHIPIHIRDICVFLAPIFRWLLWFRAYTDTSWTGVIGLFSYSTDCKPVNPV